LKGYGKAVAWGYSIRFRIAITDLLTRFLVLFEKPVTRVVLIRFLCAGAAADWVTIKA